jgi:predicted protein tyrosine phosphatase/2'-5' RNA ligase
MTLAVVAYPVLDEADRQWIESFRLKHDPQSARIGAHFTLVFPVDAEPADVEADIQAGARAAAPIAFSIHRSELVVDVWGGGTHVFLVPEEGAAAISALRDRLYAGTLRPHLRADIPFVPHITVGLAQDAAAALTLAEALDASNRVIRGVVDRIDVVDTGASVVQPIASFALTGVDGTDLTRDKLNVLFVCSRNQWRSPTAERIWRKSSRVNVRSAGTSASARRVVSSRDLEWADVVLVMESRHREILRERFEAARRAVRIEVLDIPDDYAFMEDELIRLLRARVGDVLGEDA